eukprot:391295-Rhodomonas_salina.1
MVSITFIFLACLRTRKHVGGLGGVGRGVVSRGGGGGDGDDGDGGSSGDRLGRLRLYRNRN